MAVGRPRAFDRDRALDRAMEVFWLKGYEGASIINLTRAMGINPPSLYAAFGNKESLFRQALDRYGETRADFLARVAAAPTARAAAQLLLMGSVEFATAPGHPPGCLLMQSGLARGAGAESVPAELARRRADNERMLRDRFARARAEGELPADSDPAALARFFAALTNGIATQAAAGATRAELMAVAELGMRAWPGGVARLPRPS